MEEPNIDDLTAEIMELVKIEGETPIFTKEAIEKISLAAGMARETNIYKRTLKQPEDFSDMSAGELYIHMLKKILDAPTSIHMMAVPRILIPAMDDALRREEHEAD